MSEKLTKKQRVLLDIIAHYQDSPDASCTWWQMGTSEKRLAKSLFYAHLIEEKTNDRGRRGLRLTDAGRKALDGGL